MCQLFRQPPHAISYERGRKYAYYSKFNSELEIYNDFVFHERPDHESQQAVVDFLMARWRNPLSETEAHKVARNFIETTKNDGQHWASWITPSLTTYSKPQLKQPHFAPTISDTRLSQPSSKLLSLPTEILDMIISYTIQPSHNPPLQPSNRIEGIIATSKLSLSPPLALTCRQLNSLTLPIFCSQNTFIFYLSSLRTLRLAQSYITFLNDKYIRQLQNIVLLGFVRDVPGDLLGAGLFRTWRISRAKLVPVRIGINLRNFEVGFELKLQDEKKEEEWVKDFGFVVEELKKACGGYAVGEGLLRQLLGIFAQECEDVETGKKIDWWA